MKKRPAFPWKAGRPYKWSLWKRLAKPTRSCYDRFENKNAAAYGCWRTRKPESTTYTTAPRPYPHGILYDISPLLARVPLLYLFSLSFIRMVEHASHTVPACLRGVFIFRPSSGGGPPPARRRQTLVLHMGGETISIPRQKTRPYRTEAFL